jgi:putative membrane protein
MDAAESVKNALVGVITGIFMMLPGASGATVTVVFGIYERLIHALTGIRNIMADFRFLLTLGIGVLIGVLICAKGLDFIIDSYEVPLMFFFATLILVQIPDIKKQSDDGNKVTSMNILAFAAGFLVMVGVLILGLTAGDQMESPGFIVLLLAGMVYVVCAISPGISGSTMLLALGLFTPVIEGIGDLELGTLLPFGIGAVIGVILFAKIIDRCVTEHRKSTYFAILGLTFGSVVTVIIDAALKIDGDDILPACALCAVLGVILGYGMHLFSRYYVSSKGE